MGYHFQRIVLLPDAPESLAEKLAQALRESGHEGHIVYSSFGNRRYRRPELVAAREANTRFIEVFGVKAPAVITAADEAIGAGKFLYREADDDELDILHPNSEWLSLAYPATELAWLLSPLDGRPFDLDEVAFYSIPSNPGTLSVRSPLFAAMLSPTRPRREHPCPRCGTPYTSKFAARQCRNIDCGFAYYPFPSASESYKILDISLDDFAWGRCSRVIETHKSSGSCNSSIKFTNKVEQCRRCGQLLRAIDGRVAHDLFDNQNEMEQAVRLLRRKYNENKYGKLLGRLISPVTG